MGWGMAKNAVEKGCPVRVIAHRKREAVDDLVGRGAREVASLDEMAAEADVVVLCVTGAPEVEATVAGLLPSARPGLTIIDCSTSEPDVTERLATELAERGITLRRRAAVADAGAYLVGRGHDLCRRAGGAVEKWRPLLSCWANAVIPVGGPVGSAHAVKLINNLVALGYAAIWAECYAHRAKDRRGPGGVARGDQQLGDELRKLPELLKVCGRGRSQRPQVLDRQRLKDLTYYTRLATKPRAATLMSDGALQTLKLGMAMGFGERFVPEMVDIVLALNDPKGT